ncbi:hypothetical protein EMIT0P44_230011 [Pseudomonas sp. IT-P44]
MHRSAGIASKPAPTGWVVCQVSLDFCRSRLAGDSGDAVRLNSRHRQQARSYSFL